MEDEARDGDGKVFNEEVNEEEEEKKEDKK
jgi:hypothetical protein